MLRLQSTVRKKFTCKHHKLFSTTLAARKMHCCKLLVVGGGCGGCTIAAKFTKTFSKNEIIVVEPNQIHFYQPYFTLIGAGVKKLRHAVKTTLEVLPQNVTWLRSSVMYFCPGSNSVITKNDDIIEYEFMVIAVGQKPNYDKVIGLSEALENYRNVATIYDLKYAEKTFKCLREFVSGMALFTAPKTPIKGFASAYKICFLAEDYFKREEKLCEADITYATGLSSFMPVNKYNNHMQQIAKRKNIDVHLQTNLVEIIPDRRQAVFECLKKPGNKITFDYCMLHVAPPMAPPEALTSCKELVDQHQYADVDQNTLQHKRYPNVFAIGDCLPCPFNKTVIAILFETSVVFKNISDILQGNPLSAIYDGHTACSILTGYGSCLLAEYGYKLKPCKTIPFKQDYESMIMYCITREVMPLVYWYIVLKGNFPSANTLKRMFPLTQAR